MLTRGMVKSFPNHHQTADKNSCLCGAGMAGKVSVKCTSCEQHYHVSCVSLKGLTTSTVRQLEQWTCPRCFHAPWMQPQAPKKRKISTTATLAQDDGMRGVQSVRSGVAIACLPDEILLKVMRQLTIPQLVHCSAVCQRWQSVSGTVLSTALRKLTLTFDMKRSKAAFLLKVSQNTLRECTLKGQLDIDSERTLGVPSGKMYYWLYDEIDSARTLRKITLNGLEVDETAARRFTENSLLEEVILERCVIKESSLKIIVTNLPNLISLELWDEVLDYLTGDAILSCNTLKRLVLNFCHMLLRKSSFMAGLLSKFQNTLEYLDVDFVLVDSAEVNNVTMTKLKEFRCSAIEEYNYHVGRYKLEDFLKIAPNLERVKLSWGDGGFICPLSSTLPQIAQYCRNIQFLDISVGLTLPSGSVDFGQLAPLKSLRTLEANGFLPDEQYRNNYDRYDYNYNYNYNFKSLAQVTSLTSISLIETVITDEEVRILMNTLKELRSLDLTRCPLVSADLVEMYKGVIKTNSPEW